MYHTVHLQIYSHLCVHGKLGELEPHVQFLEKENEATMADVGAAISEIYNI